MDNLGPTPKNVDMDFIYENADDLAGYLEQMHRRREKEKSQRKIIGSKRQFLKPHERKLVLSKTDGRCHICGGPVGGKWQADHVKAHSAGGEHSPDNYLAAHPVCNNYRWDYLPEAFELILRLGVMARTEIVKGMKGGQEVSKNFLQKETQRIRRRKAAALV